MAVMKYNWNGEWIPITNMKIIGEIAELYKGLYKITPKTYDQQTLETKAKRMKDNVEIEKIPQYEVSNTDGITLIIGDEYYSLEDNQNG